MPCDDVAREAAAVGAEHSDVDEVRSRRDAAGIFRRHAVGGRCAAGDDSGDVRAVTELVGHLRIAGDEAHVRDDPVCQRRVRRDAGIEDRDADAAPVDSRDAERPEQRVSGARLIRRRRRVRDHRRAAHGHIAGQMVDRRRRATDRSVLRCSRARPRRRASA